MIYKMTAACLACGVEIERGKGGHPRKWCAACKDRRGKERRAERLRKRYAEDPKYKKRKIASTVAYIACRRSKDQEFRDRDNEQNKARYWRNKEIGCNLPPRGGRCSSYKDEYPMVAYEMIRDGATQTILAQYFGVTPMVVSHWKIRHPEFRAAIDRGRGDQVAPDSGKKRIGTLTFIPLGKPIATPEAISLGVESNGVDE